MRHYKKEKSSFGYIAVIGAVYSSWFYPEFFSRPLVIIPVFSVLLLAGKREAVRYLLVLSIFMVTMFSLSSATPDISIERDAVSTLYGKVIQDSSKKRGRSTGYRMMLEAVSDSKGNLFSADGSIYVIAPSSDFIYGDIVRSDGYFSGEIFISGSAKLIERSHAASLRHHASSWIKSRLRSAGEAGELGMRLILGYGEEGVFALSENARKSGLAHVLALSGMHLSVIALIISKPLRLIFGRRSGGIIDIILFLFSFLSGWRPSLVRAFIFRMLYRNLGMDEAFMLSYVILLSLFPESVIDLGAMYSFISLGGIFILSDILDESIRSILPVPYSFSVSAAASAAALIFSIPLTIDVFGSYQLGAIITSFPFSALISVYMGLSIAVVLFPFISPVLSALYVVMEKAFEVAAVFPEFSAPLEYILLVAASLFIILIGRIISRFHLGGE